MAGTLAQRLFDAHLAFMGVEAELEHQFFLRYGDEWYEQVYYTFDHYDGSIEVYLDGRDIEEADVEFALSLGFHRCWVHPHPSEGCTRPDCDAIYRVKEG